MISIFAVTGAAFRSFFRGRRALVLENLALRQQLAVYRRAHKRTRLRSGDRAFWVWLSKLWNGWQTTLILVKPETVIRWHRQGEEAKLPSGSTGAGDHAPGVRDDHRSRPSTSRSSDG